jgi:type I restriction enzyme M protein
VKVAKNKPSGGSNGDDGKLTLQALEAHLWASADLLRGSIDAADFKNYIFGLLFVKRLSDVFEEEAEHLENDEGYDHKLAWEDPDEHRRITPASASGSAPAARRLSFRSSTSIWLA